jgi:ADP-ribose pyrophosphatase
VAGIFFNNGDYMNYKILESDIIFRGKVFDLRVDKIKYNSGNVGIREIAVHPGGAVVVPVKDDGKFIMVSQYRYPFEKFLIEFPAGKLDDNEEPRICAIRELQEETGYTAGNIIKLGAISTTPGFCTEILHIYLAQNLTPGRHNREEGEYGMEVKEFTSGEIEEMIFRGEIVDSKSICGFYMASRLLLNKP